MSCSTQLLQMSMSIDEMKLMTILIFLHIQIHASGSMVWLKMNQSINRLLNYFE